MSSVVARSSAVRKFRRLAEEDPRVIGAFLGGSLAARTADKFSDIDVYYIVKPESYSTFHAEVRLLLGKIGSLVYFDKHSNFGFDLVLFMFQNGVKGELGLGTVEKMKVMHAGPYKVLCDKERVFDGVSFPYEKIPEGDELRKFVEGHLRWYWYWYNIVQTCVSRKHLWSAIAALNSMRERVFALLRIVYLLPPGAKSEKSLPRELLYEVGKTIPQYSSKSISRSALKMTKILKREIRQLLVKTQAEYPAPFERTILERKHVQSS